MVWRAATVAARQVASQEAPMVGATKEAKVVQMEARLVAVHTVAQVVATVVAVEVVGVAVAGHSIASRPPTCIRYFRGG